ncbi:hypothetical protein [Mycobacteroides abscessus]|uniref:hypothetical protein n=2 Tax=Mycobacteriaceae TaxID=1762 RepID=UPI0013F4A523|nr:hypothetical protein [Mycobacteroides abscessus]
MLMVVTECANQVDASFAAYVTVRDALQIDRDEEIPLTALPPSRSAPSDDVHPLLARWDKPAGLPVRGTVATALIPGAISEFSGRPAEIYLPPAYFNDPRPQLPVLVLIASQPGGPRDWLSGGSDCDDGRVRRTAQRAGTGGCHRRWHR